MLRTILIAIVLGFGTASAADSAGREAADIWAASARNILGSVEVKASDEKLADVMNAFNAATEEIGYSRTATRVKKTEAVITYRGPGDAKIAVKLKEFATHTHIKVRCGLSGNDALSRKLLERVHARL